jgi:glycosyltransferase involved in cell wall biosynthesis
LDTLKISAVIPTYNSANFITDAINSILIQSYPIEEIIIVDDGSTDGTEEVIRNLQARGVRYIKQSNQGPSSARNQGIMLAKNEWIAFLDADDQWTPNKIKLQVSSLIRDKEIRLIAADMKEIDQYGVSLTTSVLAKHNLLASFQKLNGKPVTQALTLLLQKNFIPTGTVLVARQTLLEAGLFNEAIRFGEDLELWAKIAARNPIVCLPEILLLRRKHSNNATLNTECMLEDLVKVMQSLKRNIGIELANEHCDVNQLIANSLTELGYLYFTQSKYREARSTFIASLRSSLSGRAFAYLLIASLPGSCVKSIKTLRQLKSVKKLNDCKY